MRVRVRACVAVCDQFDECESCAAYSPDEPGSNATIFSGQHCQWCQWTNIDLVMVTSCLPTGDAPLSGNCLSNCSSTFHDPPPPNQVPSVPNLPPMNVTTATTTVETTTTTETETDTPTRTPTTKTIVPPPPKPPGGFWSLPVVITLSVASVIILATALAVGGWAFYKMYWLKRHYYLTLK